VSVWGASPDSESETLPVSPWTGVGAVGRFSSQLVAEQVAISSSALPAEETLAVGAGGRPALALPTGEAYAADFPVQLPVGAGSAKGVALLGAHLVP